MMEVYTHKRREDNKYGEDDNVQPPEIHQKYVKASSKMEHVSQRNELETLGGRNIPQKGLHDHENLPVLSLASILGSFNVFSTLSEFIITTLREKKIFEQGGEELVKQETLVDTTDLSALPT